MDSFRSTSKFNHLFCGISLDISGFCDHNITLISQDAKYAHVLIIISVKKGIKFMNVQCTFVCWSVCLSAGLREN